MNNGKGLSMKIDISEASGKAPEYTDLPVSDNKNMSGYLTFKDIKWYWHACAIQLVSFPKSATITCMAKQTTKE